MTSSRRRASGAALAGCVLLIIAVVYVAQPAHSLPAFFPGHVGPGNPEFDHHHIKHGIAALAIACAAFAYAWFASAPTASAAGSHAAPAAPPDGPTPE